MEPMRTALVMIGGALCSLFCSLLWATPALADGQGAPPPPPKAAETKKRVNLLINDPRLGYRDRTILSPDFTDVRREADARFRPTRAMITDDSKPRALMRQLTNNPAPANSPPGRQVPLDDSSELYDEGEAL